MHPIDRPATSRPPRRRGRPPARPLLMMGAWCLAGLQAWADPGFRVAVLTDPTLPHASVGEALLQQGTRAGWSARGVTLKQLAAALQDQAIDLVVLPAAHRMPLHTAAALHDHMSKGGHVVLLGGEAFSQPMSPAELTGLSTLEIARVRLEAPPLSRIDLNNDEPSPRWRRDARHPDIDTHVTALRSETGEDALRITIPRFRDGWEMIRLPIDPPGKGADLLRFTLRNHAAAAILVVELAEADGHRYAAPLPIMPGQRDHLLPLSIFEPFAFPRDQPRNPLRRPDPSRLNRFSIGLSANTADHHPGPYDFEITAIQFAADPHPPAVMHNPFQTLDQVLFPFDDQPGVYRFDGELSVNPAGPLAERTMPPLGPMPLAGWSSLAVELPGVHAFDPLLELRDAYGRTAGWALSVLQNRDTGGWVLFSGVESEAFLQSDAVQQVLIESITDLLHDQLAVRDMNEDAQALADAPPVVDAEEAATLQPLRIEHGRFVHADGSPHTLLGINYTGPMGTPLVYVGDRYWNPHRVRQDFARAQRQGINAMRLYLGSAIVEHPGRAQTLLSLAQEHGIHLLIHLGGYGDILNNATDLRDAADKVGRIAALFGSHDAVLGYDLQNEPYLTVLGAMSFHGQPSPLLKLRPADRFAHRIDTRRLDRDVKTRQEWPKVPRWVDDDTARQLYGFEQLWRLATADITDDFRSYSTLPGLKQPIEAKGEWAELIVAADETLAGWLDALRDAVRDAAPDKPITVGYNRDLIALPANHGRIDFQSHHVYERPHGYQTFLLNTTFMDRAHLLWPQMPVTLGEFGLSDGLVSEGALISPQSMALGDALPYLRSVAHGHDGAFRWRMNDLPIPYVKHVTPWSLGSPRTMRYEQGFGLFRYDGTPGNQPKPLAHVLRFLGRCLPHLDRDALQLHTRPAPTQVHLAYVFKGDDVLFVGADRHDGDGLAFDAADTPDGVATVMLCGHEGRLTLMSTADLTVTLDGRRWLGDATDPTLVEGRLQEAITRAGMGWKVPLLAGEIVTLSR